jgi:hypothetical protein
LKGWAGRVGTGAAKFDEKSNLGDGGFKKGIAGEILAAVGPFEAAGGRGWESTPPASSFEPATGLGEIHLDAESGIAGSAGGPARHNFLGVGRHTDTVLSLPVDRSRSQLKSTGSQLKPFHLDCLSLELVS